MKILTPSGMRKLEEQARVQCGQSPSELMENAAGAAGDVLNALFPEAAFLIVCGPGNNGGDGLALARSLAGRCRICCAAGVPREGSLGRGHWEECHSLGIEELSPRDFLDREGESCVLVDALLGTGLNRPVQGMIKQIIEKINNLPESVVSLDMPSGINGLTGGEEGISVRADHTVVFGLPKRGNLLYPGYERGGEHKLSFIGISRDLREKGESSFHIESPTALPLRKADMHKTSTGQLLVVGGSALYTGAPRFAGAAFLKSGGGYVHLALPRSAALPVSITLPEAVLHPCEEDSAGFLTKALMGDARELTRGKSLMIIGPGLGREGETGDLARHLIKESTLPLVIDGDGLTHIAGREELIKGKEVWLTPHPGEMARLLETTVPEVEKDRVGAITRAAERYEAWVVLKGAHSLMAGPEGQVYLNPTGDSSLATAGSGDILTGIIASCYGQGLKGLDALRTAVYIHGLAGEAAGTDLGTDGVTASDILAFLPRAVREYRHNYDTLTADSHGVLEVLDP